MSRTDDGKCPDIGNWCGVVRDWCDGDCMVKRIEDLEEENERLKSDIAELLKCLKKVYDEECTDFGTGEVFDRISEKMNGGAK